MTADSKHDFHPDAESLNAFAEEALAPQERGEIIVHLAECGRCRDVVFLAQEAAAQMEMELVPMPAVAAAAPQSSSTPRSKQWYKSWRLAWLPAGALAVVVTVAYVVHLRRAEFIAEVAKVEPATAPQNQPAVAAPPPAPLVVQHPSAAAPAEAAAKKMRASEPESALKEKSSPATPPSIQANRQFDSISDAAALPPSALAPPTPEAEIAAAQKEQQQSETTLQAERRAPTAMSRARTSDVAHKQVEGGALASAATPPKADAKTGFHGNSLAAGQPLTAGAFAAYKATPIDLPSGLGTISTSTANHRIVAIDAAGAVFVSDQSAGLWEAVAKQWSGRAVTVRLQSAVITNSPAAPPSSVVFELINDQRQVWVSTDGKIWIAK